MRFRCSSALIGILALIALSAGLRAQENAGNIYGQAVDDHGAVVAGATVTLAGPNAPRTTTTDSNGRFHFLEVPPGRYSVAINATGFTTVTHENVVVTLGRNTEVDLTLVSGVKEAVIVTSSTPLLDTRKTETGVTFAQAELQEIPTTRDVYAMMQQVPGIQMDVPNVAGIHTADIGGPNFTTKGSGQSAYTMDGVTITDNSYGAYDGGQNGASPIYFDFDTFQELQIATGGGNLDLQTPGASINIVTKRGTNQIKGSAHYYYTSDRWESDNTPAEAAAEGINTDKLRFVRDYGVEIGGPIVKDRVWIWGSAGRQDFGLTPAGFDFYGNRFDTDIEINPYNAKLDAQIVPSNSVNLFYTHSKRGQPNQGASSIRPPDTLRNLYIPADLYKIEDSQVFSPSLFASANYSYMKVLYHQQPVSGNDIQALWTNYDVPGVGPTGWHNSYRYLETSNPQHQANVSGSKFFTTGDVNHELKFGFGYRHQLNDSASAWPGQQVWGSIYSSSAYAAVTRGVDTRFEMEYAHALLGDTATIGNLTVSAGLRYDYQRGRNLASTGFGNQMFPEILPTETNADDPNYPFQFHDLEPRVSVTYALGKDKKTLLKASYARFADQLGTVVYQLNGFPLTAGVYYPWVDANNDHIVQKNEVDVSTIDTGLYFNLNPFTSPSVPNQLDPNFRAPRTDEVVLGVEHQLMEDFALSAAGTYRHFSHLGSHIPIGSNAGTYVLVANAHGTVTGANDFTLSFNEPFYGLTLPEQPPGDLYLNRPGAYQTFWGAELQVNKRLSHGWMMRGSFSWQDWKQHIPPEAILNPNNDWLLGAPNTDGGLAVGYGRATIWFNARWQFNLAGLYQAPLGVNVAANLFGREGYPAAYYVQTRIRSSNSVGALPNSAIDTTIGNLDDYRLDNVYELDLRLERPVRLGPVTLIPSVDLFNATNQAAVIQRDNRVGRYQSNGAFSPNSSFNNIVELQSPRILRFGLRVNF